MADELTCIDFDWTLPQEITHLILRIYYFYCYEETKPASPEKISHLFDAVEEFFGQEKAHDIFTRLSTQCRSYSRGDFPIKQKENCGKTATPFPIRNCGK
ncbi:MAG: hypothetical protein JW774_06620 [Candidatus Aureabacteria bacterium]|nr:hypothetical protein [Candidatus Auribacterota bacterium]